MVVKTIFRFFISSQETINQYQADILKKIYFPHVGPIFAIKFIMIRIEEKISDKNAVILWVEGRLDRESFPALRQMCEKHLLTGQKLELDLTGLIHIGQDGLEYFRSIRDRVYFLGLNAYLKMAILDAETEDLAS